MQLAWVQGIYVKQAIESSVFVSTLADRKVVREMPKYPEEMPYVKQKEMTDEEKVNYALNKLEKWVKLNNKNNI